MSLNLLPFCHYRRRGVAFGNIFELGRWLKEEGTCGEVAVVRIEFKVADDGTAGLILELEDDVVGELILCEWWNNPNIASWESMFAVTHFYCFSFSLHMSFVRYSAHSAFIQW